MRLKSNPGDKNVGSDGVPGAEGGGGEAATATGDGGAKVTCLSDASPSPRPAQLEFIMLIRHQEESILMYEEENLWCIEAKGHITCQKDDNNKAKSHHCDVKGCLEKSRCGHRHRERVRGTELIGINNGTFEA